MSPSTDHFALGAGTAFVVLAVSGLLDGTGLVAHDPWWALAVVVVGAAVVVAVRTVRGAVRPAGPDAAEVPLSAGRS